MVRVIVAFILAVAAGFVVGAAALSWFDQAGFLAASHGLASLTLGDRLAWFANTMTGLAITVGMYPGLLAIGLLIAFLVAAIVQRIAPGLRFWWYAGAGAVALIVMVFSLKLALGLKVLPGARTMAGVAGQAVAGFVAGAVFALASRREARRRS